MTYNSDLIPCYILTSYGEYVQACSHCGGADPLPGELLCAGCKDICSPTPAGCTDDCATCQVEAA